MSWKKPREIEVILSLEWEELTISEKCLRQDFEKMRMEEEQWNHEIIEQPVDWERDFLTRKII
jgi:hypothetical protein